MKLIDVDNAEVEVEDSWQEECPQCGDTNVQCHYIPNLTKRSSFIIGLKKIKKAVDFATENL